MRRGLAVACNEWMTLRRTVAWLAVVAVGLGGTARETRAQVEVGGQVTRLDLATFDRAMWGPGGRAGVEILPLLMLEAEASVFPDDDGPTGSVIQALGGVKFGGRGQRLGLFAKLRPGVVHLGRDVLLPGTACIAVVPTPPGCLTNRTNAALDFGSVVEVYPAARAIVRLDLGTTYIWYGSRGEARTRRTGNFSLSLGAGVRF